MTNSLHKTNIKKFIMYFVYSTINPLILTTLVIALDETLDKKSSMWPVIGEVGCWFQSMHNFIVLPRNKITKLCIFNPQTTRQNFYFFKDRL
jgi:hypothetical protein